MNKKIIDQVIVEGFQDFEQYMKINPINIEISDSEIQTKVHFYSKRYKYRFIGNSLLFSSAIIGNRSTIFITTNGLNDAKDILINGKLFQGIGVIYISEIENWDKTKNESHWTNVVLTDSAYPLAAKQFAFAFETADLHNLLNFEYSLITGKANYLNLPTEKIKSLHYILPYKLFKMLKVKKKIQ